MPIGSSVRSIFGPLEPRVSDAYRRFFVNLDDLVELLTQWTAVPRNILEVGCGEGAMTQRLTRIYPSAHITAIDISPRIGRLFRGSRTRVSFQQRTVQEVAQSQPGSFDLAVLSDVIHHIPLSMRTEILRSIRAALSPGGTLIFKDWTRSATPIHALVFFIERFITGDRVSYHSRAEIVDAVRDTFGSEGITQISTVSPWRNNIVVRITNSIT